MKYFGTQTNYLLDKSKPYQRPELRHAGPKTVNREAELERPSRVACSDLLGVSVIARTDNTAAIAPLHRKKATSRSLLWCEITQLDNVWQPGALRVWTPAAPI